MAAPKGNSFWKLRSQHGRDKVFETPQLLWEEACKYFELCDSNPLKEQKSFGTGLVVDEDKMRAYTLQGLCYFLKIGQRTWLHYKNREEFSEVIEEIEQVVYTQKFTGAAAGLLNPNIIARDLGLADTQKMELSKAPERDYSNLTDEELNLLAQLETKMLNGKKIEYLPGTL